MDSNSNSSEMYFPKQEIDSENEEESNIRNDAKLNWTSEKTYKLINFLKLECKELWDTKHPMYKERSSRQQKLEILADVFATTSEEISRKVHNLRTQFNNELRKIKRRQSSSLAEGGSMTPTRSGWEYFEALSFLRAPPGEVDPLDTDDVLNIELAKFQADEEVVFGLLNQAHTSGISLSSIERPRHALRVAASAPPPLPPSANPLMWPEQPVPKLKPGLNADECQIFGDFVASELRTLRSDESRKDLKRRIQKAILQVGEQEDVNFISE